MSRVKHDVQAKGKARCASGQGGWAIMSAMIAIFIGLIMVGGIFSLVQVAMQGSKVQKAQQNIAAVRTSLQQLYAGQPSYSGLDSDVARQAGVFPDSMVTSADNVKNAWNGDVNVSTASTQTQFEVSYTGVPQEPCVKLAKFGYGSWEAVDVGGTNVSQGGGGAVGDAVSACSGEDNTITFTSQ